MDILDKNGWHPIYIHLHSMVFTDVTLFEVERPWIGRRIGKDAIDILGRSFS